LNENSLEGVDLFAIRIEVWKIADSPPAVRLNPVVEPSEWKDKAKRSDEELTETKELQEELWTQFRDRIEESRTQLRARKPKPSHYYSNPIGHSDFHIAFANYTDDEELCLELIIEDNDEAYWYLKEMKDEIEAELDQEVYWEDPWETRGGNMRSIIGIQRPMTLEDEEGWDEYLEWMLEYGERFQEVFRDRIQGLDAT
jgi:hypothetical protein